MVKRTSHKEAPCAIARPLDAIGDWWSLLIIRDVFDGLHRFGEFQKSLGLAKNILTTRLRNLVEHGILETVPASDGSAYQQYVLTEKGNGLFPLLVALRQWGEDYFFEPHESHVRLVDRKQGRLVKRLELRSQDGRLLGPADTLVKPAGRSRRPRSGESRDGEIYDSDPKARPT
ncbi:helix-turn-helix transcriptional regulator [Caballeronia sp. SEWSISQ10-4 2]|uniref:winged helix-turn-helix transcriptional regulator n=1 Tax=Caballeronia sp. SEWSISQ10-4 2 TaxID=2937438 RepID=UPI002654623A|nr:helix-turn-helix domain-containing protein [Caballeronia sp. SEWSISQ10-4 2]MDN7177166.1 helix-turn-helix transcriptional regulator [Caballeronia sp. SEWSISQ10-4 2]